MSSVSLIDGHMDYTDDEIIKALECCINDNCSDCPETFGNCELTTMRNALDLLKRQRAKIEKLQNALFKQEDTIQMLVTDKDTEIERYIRKTTVYEKTVENMTAEIKTANEVIDKIEAENISLRAEIEKLTDSRNRWRKIAEDFDIATREKETVGE